jgi:hypothetical protein
MAALLGTGAFLPLSPRYAEAATLSPGDVEQIERLWQSHCAPWHHAVMPPTAWNVTRVRPANHPVRRIAAAALIVARARGGIVFETIERLRTGESLGERLVEWGMWKDTRLIGEGRAAGIVANVIVPFAMALAAQSNDDDLAESVSRCWEGLPAEEPNQATRRALRQVAGRERLSGLGARGMQGLIHLDATLCAPRRCFECPIALLVVEHQE